MRFNIIRTNLEPCASIDAIRARQIAFHALDIFMQQSPHYDDIVFEQILPQDETQIAVVTTAENTRHLSGSGARVYKNGCYVRAVLGIPENTLYIGTTDAAEKDYANMGSFALDIHGTPTRPQSVHGFTIETPANNAMQETSLDIIRIIHEIAGSAPPAECTRTAQHNTGAFPEPAAVGWKRFNLEFSD